MNIKSMLVANRGEIAIRIMRAANDLNLRTVAVFSEDDSASLHTKMADETYALNGRGVPAYLDTDEIIKAGKSPVVTPFTPAMDSWPKTQNLLKSVRKQGLYLSDRQSKFSNCLVIKAGPVLQQLRRKSPFSEVSTGRSHLTKPMHFSHHWDRMPG